MKRFLNTHNGGVVDEEYWTSRDGKSNLDTLLKRRENYSCDVWVGRLERAAYGKKEIMTKS